MHVTYANDSGFTFVSVFEHCEITKKKKNMSMLTNTHNGNKKKGCRDQKNVVL